MFLLFKCGDGLKIFNNVSIEKLSVGLQRFILSRSTSKCKHTFIYISDMEGEGWGVGRGQPHPLCQLGGGGPSFSLSPLEITDHVGLEKEKKRNHQPSVSSHTTRHFFYQTAHV